MITALFLCMQPAHASSLDLIEVGGVYGSPGATDATATWWNPAGLAFGRGTRYHVEGAPVIAKVNINRVDPGYQGDPDPFVYGPEEADYSGTAVYRRTTVVPFFGIASDLGQKGLGVGASLSVPHGRGAAGDPDQVTRHHLVEGGNQSLYAQVSAAYALENKVSLGLSGALVANQYQSNLFTETGTSLNDGLQEVIPRDNDYYADTVLEDERYSTHAVGEPLSDTALTFGAGIQVKATEKVLISLAYRHGFRVENEGRTALDFNCPSTDDATGRFAAESRNICDANLSADMTVGYNLPSRIHGSITYEPIETVRLEAMGGWVGWNVFTDYDIDIQVDPDSVDDSDAEDRAETAALVSQSKSWARDNRNAFWLGGDVKVRAGDRLTVGGRILFDRAAVPTNVLGPNNLDADTLAVTAMAAVHAHKGLTIGFSAAQYFSGTRTVTDSAWGLTMTPSERRDIRYFYPSMNGTFQTNITRLGLTLRGQFGGEGAPRF